jgi:hypothetical protein
MTVVKEIIGAVADAKNTEPEELDIALQNHVDTDAIQSLAEHQSDSWVLQFELPNHTVRVTGHGAIFVDGAQERTLT